MLFETFLVWFLSILIVPNLVVRVIIVDAATSTTTNHHRNINKSLKTIINKNKKTSSKKAIVSSTEESNEEQHIIYPYLGPLIREDEKIPKKRNKKNDNDIPLNLEYIGYEIDVPVGYRRLRWAMLHDQSHFMSIAFYDKEMIYTKIKVGNWNDTSLSKVIGHPTLSSNKLSSKSSSTPGNSDINPSTCIASKENEYYMPKSALIPANMCYEKLYLIEYSDYCFCIRKRARTPGVPFGKSFVAWTQYTVIDNGNHSCHIICSVEPEFVNDTKKNILMTRPIRNGMRSGTNDVFRSLVKTMNQYSNVYP